MFMVPIGFLYGIYYDNWYYLRIIFTSRKILYWNHENILTLFNKLNNYLYIEASCKLVSNITKI